MLKWLKKKIAKHLILTNEEILDDLDLYRESDRLIFFFFDGEKTRKADPMPLYRKYLDVSTDLQADFSAFMSQIPNKFAPAAYVKAMERLRNLYQVKCFEEGGLTETELMSLHKDFMFFCEEIKKKSNQRQTSPPETSDGTPSSKEEASPNTESTSVTGSTDKDNSSERPTPSRSPSPSPSENCSRP